jgi:hypothetical protein
MRSKTWHRAEQLHRIRDRIWHYLSPSVGEERDLLLEAAALLRLNDVDVIKLARVHFLLSDEVGDLLNELPSLLRRLSTTSAHIEERSTERVRGSIRWPSTFAARRATGLPHIYVTAPARRAFQTNENELLVYVLDAIADVARDLSWESATGIGATIRARQQDAARISGNRQLLEIERHTPTPRTVARVRSGRNCRRYAAVLAAYDRHRALIGQLDRTSLRELVEQRALALTDDPILFEISCLFDTIDALQELGWNVDPLALFGGGLRLNARTSSETLMLRYQTTPKELRIASRYVAALKDHELAAQDLRPDIILEHRPTIGQRRLLIVEVKGYRKVEHGARAALQNLLAYREAYRDSFDDTSQTAYGLGITWGAELEPAPSRVMLSTPDHIRTALELWFAQVA